MLHSSHVQSEAQAREALQDALDELDVLQDEADSARKVGASSLSFCTTPVQLACMSASELRVWCCAKLFNWHPATRPRSLIHLASRHTWFQETKRVTKEKRELEKEIHLLKKELSKAGVTPHKVGRLSSPHA